MERHPYYIPIEEDRARKETGVDKSESNWEPGSNVVALQREVVY